MYVVRAPALIVKYLRFEPFVCYISPSAYALVHACLHQLKWPGLSAPSCERLYVRILSYLDNKGSILSFAFLLLDQADKLDPAGLGINMEVWIRYVTSYLYPISSYFINDCYKNALAMVSRCLHTPDNYVLFSPTWVSYHVEDLK
ncbi:hypothetical protein V1477_021100 [Vespula maculifrons]|uniref:Uncharacterized protein n=1 Tax=Vespula maculifrons TaxID=7453 RepID=A0ABD2AH57_VESMC